MKIGKYNFRNKTKILHKFISEESPPFTQLWYGVKGGFLRIPPDNMMQEEKRMVKTYVIDTNVLIQNPRALEYFEDNRVILPIVVLEELVLVSLPS